MGKGGWRLATGFSCKWFNFDCIPQIILHLRLAVGNWRLAWEERGWRLVAGGWL